METRKIIGYVLLVVGILLIVVPLWQTYNIFTGRASPAQIFMRPAALTIDQQASPLDVQKQIQNALIRVVPIDFIDNTLNLIAWLLLLWILIYGGGKIAEIGVKLLNGTK